MKCGRACINLTNIHKWLLQTSGVSYTGHCNIIALIFIKPGREAAEIKGECPGAIEVVLI